jgi:hypothetical protein
MIDADLNTTAEMQMELRYLIDTSAQSIRVRAYIETFADFTDGAHKVYIPIVEHLTTKNKETNGETEFHNVFKKMLPAAQGEIIIGALDSGTALNMILLMSFKAITDCRSLQTT